jgi:hypothetical protein
MLWSQDSNCFACQIRIHNDRMRWRTICVVFWRGLPARIVLGAELVHTPAAAFTHHLPMPNRHTG